MAVRSDRRRRDLGSILSLALGTFILISLLPVSLTGPLGQRLGQLLQTYLGIGAVVVATTLVMIAVAGFGRLPRMGLGRAAVLGGGFALLIPYSVAVSTGLTTVDQLPADHAVWAFPQSLIGLMPAFLAIGVSGAVGTAGAILIGIVGLSVLTLYTIGWHPFTRLVPPESHADRVVDMVMPEEPDPGPQPALTPHRSFQRFLRRPRGVEADDNRWPAGVACKPFPITALSAPRKDKAEDAVELDRLGNVLIDTLKTFRVEADLGDHRSTGPVVTRYEVAPAPGVKVGRIAALADDLALKMEAKSIRIVAPIPGKSFVGVEVPNPTPRVVTLRELLATSQWDRSRAGLPIALGKDLEGRPVMADLTQMPHLLIAGATGSGKSVCINTIITSLIYRYDERQLRMLMVDPKMVELITYNSLPHLIHPVVTDNRDAAKALKWAMYEMEDRYALFSVNNVRNVHEFNRKLRRGKPLVTPRRPSEETALDTLEGAESEDVFPYTGTALPYVVVIVDELADLIMTVQNEVEKPLAILAQKARATGIHLVLATQRPSVNVITGLIKANFPSRIAFRVASKVDSRTILDQNGAESLLGNGDMLFLPPGRSEPLRLQGAFIATEETERVTGWYAEQRAAAAETQHHVAEPAAHTDILTIVEERESVEGGSNGKDGKDVGDRDALFRDAAEVCIQQQQGSTSLLQRRLRIGYGRAARIIDQLHEAGILGPADGAKGREVLVGMDQLDEY